MRPMIKNELFTMWKNAELAQGRDIDIKEVSEATGLNWETVANLKEGKTTRFDANVIAQICKFFGVKPGQPVPFLIFDIEAQ